MRRKTQSIKENLRQIICTNVKYMVDFVDNVIIAGHGINVHEGLYSRGLLLRYGHFPLICTKPL